MFVFEFLVMLAADPIKCVAPVNTLSQICHPHAP